MDRPDTVLLGTIAIEPNRWGLVASSRAPTTRVSEWLTPIEAAGFDGLELWEAHATAADAGEVAAIAASAVPVRVFNSYAGWDDPNDDDRRAAAAWAHRLSATGVKFNVGADPAAEGAYAERTAAFVDACGDGVRALCECHAGTVAEDPASARRILERAAPADRLGAIVHLHPTPDQHLRPALDVLGDRIDHVHVQLHAAAPDVGAAQLAEDLGVGVELIRARSSPRSWTVEFSQPTFGFSDGASAGDDRPDAVLRSATRDLEALRLALR